MQQAVFLALKDAGERRLGPEKVIFESFVVQFEYDDGRDRNTLSISQATSLKTIKATTIVQFSGPQQAGFKEWPDIKMSVGSRFIEASKQDLGELLARTYPDLYGERGKYKFGQEPRTLQIEETYVIQEQESALVTQQLDVLHGSQTANVVMGFSKSQPIDYTRIEILSDPTGTPFATATMKFSSRLDLTMRLPVTVKLDMPDVIEPSRDYFPKASLTPRDFSESQYAALGLLGTQGDELAADMAFDVDIILSVLGSDPLTWHEATNIDIAEICGCADFTTPFGLDENGKPREFPMHDIRLPPRETGFSFEVDTLSVSGKFGLGLRFVPDFDPTNISAEWLAVGDSLVGPTSGEITFTAASPTRFPFGPLRSSGSGTDIEFGEADIALDSFKFNLDRFTLEFAARLQFYGTALGFNDPVVNSYFEVFEFDARGLVPPGSDPYISQVQGTGGIETELDVLSGSGVPGECKPFRPARGGGSVHGLTLVSDEIQPGDDVRIVARLQGSTAVDQVRFLWYDASNDQVRDRVRVPADGFPGSVRDTLPDISGTPGSVWHVIGCYQDKSSVGVVTHHLDVTSFSIQP
jgi:hypothetical protein